MPTKKRPLGWGSITLTLGGAFLMAFLFFGFLPHWLSGKAGYLVGRSLTPADFTFHVVDGVIKATFLVLYIWGISFFRISAGSSSTTAPSTSPSAPSRPGKN